MKNKLLILFVLLISVLVISSITVYAEDEDNDPDTSDTGDNNGDDNGGDTDDDNETNTDTPESWALNYTSTDYDYTIEGVTLKIYKIDKNSTTTQTTTDPNGNTSTVIVNQDLLAYINGTPTKTINLNKADFTINPEIKNDQLTKIKTTFVNLNLDLTKEKLGTLLADEISSTTADVSYMVEVVVNYKLTRFPEKFKYYQNSNLLRTTMSVLAQSGTGIIFDPSVDINDTISQVVNIVSIQKADTESVLLYDTEMTADNDLMSYIFNPLVLSEVDLGDTTIRDEPVDPTKEELLLFHNISNIQYLIDNINKVEQSSYNDAKDTLTDTVSDLEVQVPNTGKNDSIIIAMFGTVILLTGLMIIGYVLKIKQLFKYKKQGTI